MCKSITNDNLFTLVNGYLLSRSALFSFFLSASIAAIVLVPFLNYSKVFQVSEGREGVVVNEILEFGDLVMPLRHGEIVPSKPLLFHWICAGVANFRGQLDEFGLRIVSVFGAILCVGSVSYSLALIGGLRMGLFGAAILLTTYGFVHLGMDGRVDMLFVSLTTISILIWINAYARLVALGKSVTCVSTVVYMQCAVFAGLAILCKGPLGLVLPILVICAIAFTWEGFRGLFSVTRIGWLFALLISAPWYFLATIKNGDGFIARQIVFENISRFIGGQGIPHKPFWYYVVHIWGQGAPWSLALIVFAFAIVKLRKSGHSLSAIFGGDSRSIFVFYSAFCWIASVMCFLSLSSGKRRSYLLMVLPPLAIMIVVGLPLLAWFIQSRFKVVPKNLPCRVWSTWTWLFIVMVTAGVAGVIYIVSLGGMSSANFNSLYSLHNKTMLLLLSQLSEVVTPFAYNIVVSSLILLVLSIALWYQGKKRNNIAFIMASIFCYTQIIFILFVHTGLAVKGAVHTYKDFSLVVANYAGETEPVYFVKERFDESFDGFFFYFGRRIMLHDPKSELPINKLCLVRNKRLPELIYNRERYKLVVIETGGRKVDEDEEKLVLFKIINSQQ